MARIAGVTLPDKKKASIGLTAIYGIGRRNVGEILKKAEIDPDKRLADLTSSEVTRLVKAIEEFPVEGTLRKKVAEDVKRLNSIGTYRGLRHNQGLPARGQRTRSNARTKRGKRKTVGAMKKRDLTRLAPNQKNDKENLSADKQKKEA